MAARGRVKSIPEVSGELPEVRVERLLMRKGVHTSPIQRGYVLTDHRSMKRGECPKNKKKGERIRLLRPYMYQRADRAALA